MAVASSSHIRRISFRRMCSERNRGNFGFCADISLLFFLKLLGVTKIILKNSRLEIVETCSIL